MLNDSGMFNGVADIDRALVFAETRETFTVTRPTNYPN